MVVLNQFVRGIFQEGWIGQAIFNSLESLFQLGTGFLAGDQGLAVFEPGIECSVLQTQALLDPHQPQVAAANGTWFIWAVATQSVAVLTASLEPQLPDLIDLVWQRKIHPGKVFDLTLPLDQVAEGYRAMDERRAVKALLRP